MEAQPTQRRHWKVLKGHRCTQYSLATVGEPLKPTTGILRGDSPTDGPLQAGLAPHHSHIWQELRESYVIGLPLGKTPPDQVPAVRPQSKARCRSLVGRGEGLEGRQFHPALGNTAGKHSLRAGSCLWLTVATVASRFPGRVFDLRKDGCSQKTLCETSFKLPALKFLGSLHSGV